VHAGEELQAALDAASAGDTLQVEAGTYRGNFIVRVPLSLQGVGSPVLDGDRVLNRDTLTLLADGIHVEGFVITRSARAGINLSSHQNVIRGNEVVNNDQFGIAVWGRGNVIEGNNCSGTSGSIRNGIGIYLSRSDGSRLSNNTLLHNGKNGIQISYSSSLLLENNLISQTGGRAGGGHGIRLENSAFVILRDNQIRDCRTDGLYLYNASHSQFHTLLLDNTTTGIYLSGTDNATFERIIIQNNRVGMDLSSSGNVQPDRVFGSSFVANTLPVRSLGSTVELNSSQPLPYRYGGRYYQNYTGNHWDTCSCQDGDVDGIGDQAFSVSSGVIDSFPLISSPAFYDWDPDVTPPGTVSHLNGSSPDPTTFCWTWQDPADEDLDHLRLYLNGTFLGNLSPGVETHTLNMLTPSTAYTLGILTVDTVGNRNLTWVNHTGLTLPLPDPTLSPTEITPTVTPTTPPQTRPPQTPLPTTQVREGSNRRNTRYIPPPSPAPQSIPSFPPVTEQADPSPSTVPPPTIITETPIPAPRGMLPPWITDLPAPAVALLAGVLAAIGYRFLRDRR
jgi:Nitrous oxidase accessory protein